MNKQVYFDMFHYKGNMSSTLQNLMDRSDKFSIQANSRGVRKKLKDKPLCGLLGVLPEVGYTWPANPTFRLVAFRNQIKMDPLIFVEESCLNKIKDSQFIACLNLLT